MGTAKLPYYSVNEYLEFEEAVFKKHESYL